MLPKQMVSFTVPQLAFLKDESQRLGISVAELVRRIVDVYRAQQGQEGCTDAER